MSVFGNGVSVSTSVTVPQFLTFRGVGLNISDHSVKMMEFTQDGDKFVPSRFDSEDVPEGVVSSGDIKDRKPLSDVLSTLQQRHNLSFVRLSIPEENGYIFNIKVPAVDDVDLRETVSLRLDEKIPVPADSVVFDFDVAYEADDGAKFLTVSALPQEIVGEYMEICREANLTPLSFEIEAQSICRAVVPPEDDSAVMIIDIGKSRTGIFIANNGTVVYTSTLQMGGDTLTEAVAETTGRSVAEAETYKQEHGFVKNSHVKDEFRALYRAAGGFVEEAVRRFRYWHSNPTETVRESGDISRVLLVGGNASVPGLAEHISAELDVPVEIGNVWKNAFDLETHIPDIDFRHSLTYAPAIGLALANEL